MTPFVSIIIPCFNEASTIHLLLEALYAQTYPREALEVVIADGMSSDGTRQQIRKFQDAHPELVVTVVDNPKRIIPSGLNAAIRAARGEIIVRLDAHSIPKPDYVERCVEDLNAGLGDNVGGVWEIRPGAKGLQGRTIAAAAAHPLGVGDAHYRFARQAQEVDTVPFGAFRRATVESIGMFDESLLTNEDYEFNVRLRRAGGKIWLDPSIRCVYFARSTLTALGKQYWRYGFWKARMLRRYPGTMRWRQVLPPVFVLSIPVLLLLAAFFRPMIWLFVIELLAYSAFLFIAAAMKAYEMREISLILGLPLAIATMHLAWGSGFLWSIVSK